MASPITRMLDVHAHHYPDVYLNACRQPGSGFEHYVRDDGRLVVLQDGAVSLAAPQPMPSVQQRLAAMDAAGIEKQVISLSAPNVFRLPLPVRQEIAKASNDEYGRMAADSGGRLLTFASLPLPDLEPALAELDRVAAMDHVVGIILCTTIDRRPLDDPGFAPLLEELSRRKTVVFVHPTTPCCTDNVREYALALALDYLAETTNAIARLVYSGTMERYSGIRWIFGHLGGTTPFLIHRFDNYYQQFPECREHLHRPPSEVLRSVYFDTVTTHVPALKCALSTFDVSQMLFGTDYPHVPGGMVRFRDTLVGAGLGDEDLARVGWSNAAELLGVG